VLKLELVEVFAVIQESVIRVLDFKNTHTHTRVVLVRGYFLFIVLFPLFAVSQASKFSYQHHYSVETGLEICLATLNTVQLT
jgi:hypothetical protein